jgi:hypothetical protein
MNVYNRNWRGFADNPAGTADVRPYELVHHARDCVKHTKETHVAVLEKLAGYKLTMNTTAFKEQSSLLGFTYHPRSLIIDNRLRDVIDAPNQTMFDWAHCILQGIMGVVVYDVLVAIAPVNARPVSFRALHNFLTQWTFPRRLESNTSGARAIFTPKRITSHLDAKVVKLTMTEGLALVPLFRHWLLFEIIPSRPDLRELCICALLLMQFVQMIHISVRFAVDHVLVGNVYQRFLASFTENSRSVSAIPKFHFLLHVPDYIRRFGLVLNCIVTERKHKVVKSFADIMDNPRGLARSLLRESVSQQISELSNGEHLDLSPHLLGRVSDAGADLRDWLVSCIGVSTSYKCSAEARVNEFLTIAIGDIIVISLDGGDWYVGRPWYFVNASDGVLFAIVDRYTFVSSCLDYSVWQEGNNPSVVLFEAILDVTIHRRDSDGRVTVIHPYSLRRLI